MPIFKGKNKNRLTPKEKGFCDDYLDTGNASEAARRNYDISDPNGSTTRVLGNHVLNRPFVQSYLEGMAEGAISRIENMSKTAKNESVKLSANKDILDRAGFSAVSRTDLTTQGDKLNFYTDEQIKRAAAEIVRNPTLPAGKQDAPDAGTTSQE